MILKIYEISCNWCAAAWHGYHSIKVAEAEFRRLGGIVVNGKHFCDEKCKKEYNDNDGRGAAEW